jgi:hypothetical protein
MVLGTLRASLALLGKFGVLFEKSRFKEGGSAASHEYFTGDVWIRQQLPFGNTRTFLPELSPN